MIAPDADAPIEFMVTSSLADAIAAETPTGRTQTKRRARVRRLVMFAAVFLLTGAATGISSNPADPMAFLKTLMLPRMGLMALTSVIAIIGIIVGMTFGARAINRALRRTVLIDFRRRHPAVDASDPDLRITRTFRFDETGMTTSTAYDEVWESWSPHHCTRRDARHPRPAGRQHPQLPSAEGPARPRSARTPAAVRRQPLELEMAVLRCGVRCAKQSER